MFYCVKVKDHIRVPPKLFDLVVEDAVLKQVKEEYEGFVSKELGFVIGIADIERVGEGIIVPGDGASYYETEFKLLVFKPEMHELVLGRIKDIAEFGAFIDIGPAEGMIHISQTMDDFVSFAKDRVLTGKETKKVLKVGDKCRARIIALSFKDPANPKIGLTMRQPKLGKFEWFEEAKTKKAEATKTKAKKKAKKR